MLRHLLLFAVVGSCGMAAILVVICLLDSFLFHVGLTDWLLRPYRAFLNGIPPWLLIACGSIALGSWLFLIFLAKGAEVDFTEALHVGHEDMSTLSRRAHNRAVDVQRFVWVALVGLGFIGWGVVRLLL